MTEAQFCKISSLRRKIEVLQNLVDRARIPVEIANSEGNRNDVPSKLYPIYDIYELPEKLQDEIREILDCAGIKVKGLLLQNLAQLEEQFSKIEIKDENT